MKNPSYRILRISGVVTLYCWLAMCPVVCEARSDQSRVATSWTILIYAGVDSSSESHVMPHLAMLSAMSGVQQNGRVVLFIDRSPEHTQDQQTLGENFDDSRLFELKAGKWVRVSGAKEYPEISTTSKYESNSGSPRSLQKFIRFGKRHAPADKFALVVFGHGECRFVCPDESNPNPNLNEQDDPLYVSEITENIGDDCSVDFLWMDVCAFGSIENAYQFRPGTGRFSANIMLASPPSSAPLPMGDILRNVGILGEPTDQKSLPSDAAEFGRRVMEQCRTHLKKHPFRGFREVWSLYDLTAAEKVKKTTDQLARLLAGADSKVTMSAIRGLGKKPATMNYMRTRNDESLMWLVAPNFDLFDFAQRISVSKDVDGQVNEVARELRSSVDELILDSVAGSAYKNFQAGKNGIYIVFTDGDKIWRDQSHWHYFQWYCPNDRTGNRYAYGKYSWSRDGAKAGNEKVENWFELLDSWFDKNDANGGMNEYRW